jgi:hypothetical protein
VSKEELKTNKKRICNLCNKEHKKYDSESDYVPNCVSEYMEHKAAKYIFDESLVISARITEDSPLDPFNGEDKDE